jgi:hypothetical protein
MVTFKGRLFVYAIHHGVVLNCYHGLYRYRSEVGRCTGVCVCVRARACAYVGTAHAHVGTYVHNVCYVGNVCIMYVRKDTCIKCMYCICSYNVKHLFSLFVMQYYSSFFLYCVG